MITLQIARSIIREALAYRIAQSMKPLAVAVLDAGGHLIACEREDGAANKRFDIAYAKAHGAIAMGLNSRTLGVMASERPSFISGVASAIGGALVPVAGGVIIINGADHIGVVGVSGDTSDHDEAAAIAGILASGLTPAER